MHLKEWLFRTGTSQVKLARDIGMNSVSFSHYLTGKRGISKERAAQIVEYTKGMCTLEELLFPEQHETFKLKDINGNNNPLDSRSRPPVNLQPGEMPTDSQT